MEKLFVLLWVCAVGLGASEVNAPKPLSVPKLDDLIQPWVFVRASEASTLFIDDQFRGREPYGHLLAIGNDRFQWLEFDGSATTVWDVTEIHRSEKQLTLHLSATATDREKKPSRLVVYPYWDIDHCLVMIRFVPGAEENPVRFCTPYAFKDNLPYRVPEG